MRGQPVPRQERLLHGQEAKHALGLREDRRVVVRVGFARGVRRMVLAPDTGILQVDLALLRQAAAIGVHRSVASVEQPLQDLALRQRAGRDKQAATLRVGTLWVREGHEVNRLAAATAFLQGPIVDRRERHLLELRDRSLHTETSRVCVCEGQRDTATLRRELTIRPRFQDVWKSDRKRKPTRPPNGKSLLTLPESMLTGTIV